MSKNTKSRILNTRQEHIYGYALRNIVALQNRDGSWGNKQEDKLFKKAFAKLRTMPKVFFQSKTSSSERAIRAPARAMSSRFARWISSVTEDVQSLRTVTS